jgi:hypothetical protein
MSPKKQRLPHTLDEYIKAIMGIFAYPLVRPLTIGGVAH